MNAGESHPRAAEWIGLAGVTLLVVITLAMAAWDSGVRYQTEKIESTLEQASDQRSILD